MFLEQSRVNISLSVITWALRLLGSDGMGTDDDGRFKFSHAYLRAFMQLWQASKFDLTWFTSGQREALERVLGALRVQSASCEYSVDEFMQTCARKEVSEGVFERVGPAMVMRYLLEKQLVNPERPRWLAAKLGLIKALLNVLHLHQSLNSYSVLRTYRSALIPSKDSYRQDPFKVCPWHAFVVSFQRHSLQVPR